MIMETQFPEYKIEDWDEYNLERWETSDMILNESHADVFESRIINKPLVIEFVDSSYSADGILMDMKSSMWWMNV